MTGLHVIKNANGDYFVGFDADGTFIPVSSVSGARVTQLQERAANLAELAKADDAESVKRHNEAAAGLPYSTTATKQKGGAS